jgi:hypothetical protein
MKEWLVMKAKVFGKSIKQWNQTQKGWRRMQRTQSVAIQMQRPMKSSRTIALMALMTFTTVAMQTSGSDVYDNAAMFDTDSASVGMDNRCMGCISHKVNNFEGPQVKSNRSIKGFGGTQTNNVMIGTIAWKWQDNEGQMHKFLIPKSFYVQDGNVCLLSPQHWVQMQGDMKPI